MASDDATLPPRCPPKPSATAYSGGAEILHEPRAVPRIQARMELRRIAVVDPHMAGLGPSDLHRFVEGMRRQLAPVFSSNHEHRWRLTRARPFAALAGCRSC